MLGQLIKRSSRQSNVLVSLRALVPSYGSRTLIAAFCSADLSEYKPVFLEKLKNEQNFRSEMAYSLSFASDEVAFKEFFTPEPSEEMKEQLALSASQLRDEKYCNSSLPLSMSQALQEKDQAVVITEATPPFQIVHVNEAWEGLCGWKLGECRGKTLSLIQGRETDLAAVTSLMNQLMRGEEGGVVLTNYTRNGRRFRNYLRVGTMIEGLFVGALQEIHDGL